jgi:hypothetical protein
MHKNRGKNLLASSLSSSSSSSSSSSREYFEDSDERKEFPLVRVDNLSFTIEDIFANSDTMLDEINQKDNRSIINEMVLSINFDEHEEKKLYLINLIEEFDNYVNSNVLKNSLILTIYKYIKIFNMKTTCKVMFQIVATVFINAVDYKHNIYNLYERVKNTGVIMLYKNMYDRIKHINRKNDNDIETVAQDLNNFIINKFATIPLDILDKILFLLFFNFGEFNKINNSEKQKIFGMRNNLIYYILNLFRRLLLKENISNFDFVDCYPGEYYDIVYINNEKVNENVKTHVLNNSLIYTYTNCIFNEKKQTGNMLYDYIYIPLYEIITVKGKHLINIDKYMGYISKIQSSFKKYNSDSEFKDESKREEIMNKLHTKYITRKLKIEEIKELNQIVFLNNLYEEFIYIDKNTEEQTLKIMFAIMYIYTFYVPNKHKFIYQYMFTIISLYDKYIRFFNLKYSPIDYIMYDFNETIFISLNNIINIEIKHNFLNESVKLSNLLARFTESWKNIVKKYFTKNNNTINVFSRLTYMSLKKTDSYIDDINNTMKENKEDIITDMTYLLDYTMSVNFDMIQFLSILYYGLSNVLSNKTYSDHVYKKLQNINNLLTMDIFKKVYIKYKEKVNDDDLYQKSVFYNYIIINNDSSINNLDFAFLINNGIIREYSSFAYYVNMNFLNNLRIKEEINNLIDKKSVVDLKNFIEKIDGYKNLHISAKEYYKNLAINELINLGEHISEEVERSSSGFEELGRSSSGFEELGRSSSGFEELGRSSSSSSFEDIKKQPITTKKKRNIEEIEEKEKKRKEEIKKKDSDVKLKYYITELNYAQGKNELTQIYKLLLNDNQLNEEDKDKLTDLYNKLEDLSDSYEKINDIKTKDEDREDLIDNLPDDLQNSQIMKNIKNIKEQIEKEKVQRLEQMIEDEKRSKKHTEHIETFVKTTPLTTAEEDIVEKYEEEIVPFDSSLKLDYMSMSQIKKIKNGNKIIFNFLQDRQLIKQNQKYSDLLNQTIIDLLGEKLNLQVYDQLMGIKNLKEIKGGPDAYIKIKSKLVHGNEVNLYYLNDLPLGTNHPFVYFNDILIYSDTYEDIKQNDNNLQTYLKKKELKSDADIIDIIDSFITYITYNKRSCSTCLILDEYKKKDKMYNIVRTSINKNKLSFGKTKNKTKSKTRRTSGAKRKTKRTRKTRRTSGAKRKTRRTSGEKRKTRRTSGAKNKTKRISKAKRSSKKLSRKFNYV